MNFLDIEVIPNTSVAYYFHRKRDSRRSPVMRGMVLGKRQCQGLPLIWVIVGQGPIALAVSAVGGRLTIFSLVCLFSFLSSSMGDGPK